MSRSALLLGCTALLTTSAAQPPLPGAVPPAAAQDRHSPVRCVKQAPVYTSGTVVRRGRGPVSAPVPTPPPMPMYAPLPSPPPPPSSAGVVMQEFRAAPAAKVATPGYGTPGNTERYDGRPVAAIQSVTDQPVSTFSVDVDTGA